MTNLKTLPFVSVLIRSRDRLESVRQILELCMEQSYENYEIVVLEQSTAEHWASHRGAIESYDDRVRVVRTEPLGPAGARNAGVAVCKGEIILFIDDDDLPVGDNWISGHAKNYADPLCIGVGGKHIHRLNEGPRYRDMERAYQRCMTLSFMLRGRVFTGVNKVKKPVEWLFGNNHSVRKDTIVELGGWYPHILGAGEEHSLYFKFQKVKAPGEYLMFDPEPTVLRRFDIPGGLDRRFIALRPLLVRRMEYYHWVIAEHFPWRFYGLYPLFMLYGFRVSARYLRKLSYYKHPFWTGLLGERYGRKMYVLMEFIMFPLLVIRFIFTRKPKWDGRIVAPKPLPESD